MIINVRNMDDLLTVDVRTRQIRLVKNYFATARKMLSSPVEFLNISRDDADAFEELFKEDKGLFFTSLIEEVYDFTGIKLKKKDLKVVTL